MSGAKAGQPGRGVTCAALALLICLASQLVAVPEAGAKRGIDTGIWADGELQSGDASVRDLWFGWTVEANADLVRLNVSWRTVVGTERPTDPRDPADPAYDFSSLDAAVRDANERGLKVLFTLYDAPDWAEGPGRPAGATPGAWRPDPSAIGKFGTALATRYAGDYPTAGPGALPRVRYFEAWNEPNLDIYLAPQWVGDRLEGAAIYRGLLNSFYDAVHEVESDNVVVSGGTTSFGDPPGGDRSRPVSFLRELFCLEGRKKLQPRPGCAQVKMDVLAHHPISTQNPPTYSAISPDDAAIPDIDSLRRVLRAAEKAGIAQPDGKRPIWVTEFWWHSAVPDAKQARYIQQALYLFWKQRVRVAIHFVIRDADPLAGLFSPDGTPKPGFQAFRFPFVTERLARKRVRAWGRSPKSGKVKIQAKKGGKWRTLKRSRVREDEVFTARLRGSKQMRAQIGGEESLVW